MDFSVRMKLFKCQGLNCHSNVILKGLNHYQNVIYSKVKVHIPMLKLNFIQIGICAQFINLKIHTLCIIFKVKQWCFSVKISSVKEKS